MTNTVYRSGTTLRLPAAERRRQLLDVAVHTFAEHGFHGTSMNGVAEAAGVTKPVLYQHFASKKALYRELVEDLGSGLEQAIVDAVALADGPRQQVEAGFRAYFRWATRQGAAFRVLFADGNRADGELAAGVAKVEAMVAETSLRSSWWKGSATTSAMCWPTASSASPSPPAATGCAWASVRAPAPMSSPTPWPSWPGRACAASTADLPARGGPADQPPDDRARWWP